MRILYVAPAYPPAFRVRGPVLVVSALAETLVRQGHEVTVFATNSNTDESGNEDLDVPVDCPQTLHGVTVWYFRRRDTLKRCLAFVPYLTQSLGWLYAPRLAQELRQQTPQFDVVHAHVPFIYPTYAAARAARRGHKPFFYQQHGILLPERLRYRSLKKRLYLAAIERPILRSATTLIALTEAEVASYRALGSATTCQVVPNGIDVHSYRCTPRPETAARWRLPPDALVVLFLGRLHPFKGADLLIEAFLKIAERIDRAILVMAGPDDGRCEHRYREAIQAAGLGDRVRFPGMVLGEDKLDLLARADMFCLPSYGEGFSMAVLEALASGTAVVLSPECYFPEAETAGAARVVPLQVDALAAALADLLSRPEQRHALRQAGLNLVRESYSWEHVARRMTAVYEEGISRFRSLGTAASGA